MNACLRFIATAAAIGAFVAPALTLWAAPAFAAAPGTDATAAVVIDAPAFAAAAASADGSAAATPAETEDELVLTVRSSPAAELYTQLVVRDRTLWTAVAEGTERLGAPGRPFVGDVFVTLRAQGRESTFAEDARGALYRLPDYASVPLGAEARSKLARYAEAARSRHYGEFTPWSEADRLLPNKSRFTVTDLETGLSFRAQRRAGGEHADVQPLTRRDAKIMKAIYGGKWSWDRRAVVVGKDGRSFAASMNGMPHGGDGIPGNGFAGHFCIHFEGSATHGSGKVDAAHQWMVHKAAGRTDAYLSRATPGQLADVFLAAVRTKDEQTLKLLYANPGDEQIADWLRFQDDLAPVRRRDRSIEEPPADALAFDLETEVRLYRRGESGSEGAALAFAFRRASVADGWRIEHVEICCQGR